MPGYCLYPGFVFDSIKKVFKKQVKAYLAVKILNVL